VSDASGRGVPGASVTLLNTGTNFKRELTTDENGRFRGLLMPLGSYKVTAKAPNLSTLVREGINLAVGVHGEASADDRLEGDLSAGNRHQVAGLHLTPIITRGRSQYRIGIFVPLLKGGDKEETDFKYELRGGWETFF